MSKVLNDLLHLLALEQIEQGLYRGQSQDLGFAALFGGQVMGQALSAAKRTVEAERKVHSFHSYFLRAGDAKKPIIYDVEVIRDGATTSTRQVKAIQYGRPIFYMTASFQFTVPGFEHQDPMPNVEGPENLISEYQLAQQIKDQIPEKVRSRFLAEQPIEIKPLNLQNPLQPLKTEPKRFAWIRAKGDMPDDVRIHKYLLAYASDFGFLPTALQPHGRSFMDPTMQVATIDHSMWFHHDLRIDDWLLYAIESPVASNGRGFVRGQFFTPAGKLVASTVQEGVIRPRKAE